MLKGLLSLHILVSPLLPLSILTPSYQNGIVGTDPFTGRHTRRSHDPTRQVSQDSRISERGGKHEQQANHGMERHSGLGEKKGQPIDESSG